jgi:hypothetical protein
MNKFKETAIAALRQMMGDDAQRARKSFAGLTDALLDQPYGESGMTRREVLRLYATKEALINETIDWIEQRCIQDGVFVTEFLWLNEHGQPELIRQPTELWPSWADPLKTSTEKES